MGLGRTLALFLLMALSLNAASQDPDFSRLSGAIAIVIAKGVNPTLGNQPVASQGTGFFVSKDGFFVTAYHLRKELGSVDQATVSYELHLGPGDVVPASQMFVDPGADVMVLYASVGDRNVPVLQPSERTGVVAGTTPVYTAGYPAGYRYSVDKGIIKSFGGPIAPVPLWTTSLTFKVGQSGSPILIANGRVIAFAKADDRDASSIGLIVPVRVVPSQYWDGSLQLTDAEKTTLRTGKAESLGRLIVAGLVKPTAPAARQHPFKLSNAPCAGAASKKFHISASDGWGIDPASVRLKIVNIVGASSQPIVVDPSQSGFDIASQLTNVGVCPEAFGLRIPADLPATVTGVAEYTEVPSMAADAQYITYSDTAVIGNVKVPLPNISTESLSFSVKTKNGDVRSYQPIAADFTVKDGRQFLDTSKVLGRMSGS
jgi:hypothetical protein